MEETKKTNTAKEVVVGTADVPGCPWWIFADKNSADNDLKEKFEIVEDEKKD